MPVQSPDWQPRPLHQGARELPLKIWLAAASLKRRLPSYPWRPSIPLASPASYCAPTPPAPRPFRAALLQDHLKDNPHILSYYRANYNFRRSLRSLFGIHNETGNIWTHLIGA